MPSPSTLVSVILPRRLSTASALLLRSRVAALHTPAAAAATKTAMVTARYASSTRTLTARRPFASGSSGSSPPPPPEQESPDGVAPWVIALGVGALAAAGYFFYFRDADTDQGSCTNFDLPPAAHKKPVRGHLGLEPLSKDTTVVFVLGGPGAGKGTQCANLVRDFGFIHLSAGDLLREERQRPGSPYGELINTIIKEGQIVPMEITISLLHKAMKESGATRFLIDGFPRAVDQSDKFEEEVCEGKLVLYFECPEEELLKRLLKRGETSGRVDDNIESIKKRFAVFKSTSYPVIEAFEKRGKVAKVAC
ncbi:hypothetical protein HK405_006522 [Cladochytrium tenue]|nr:hypothetical protein HK405_006522 [Cladochytrium tenue]